MAVYKAIWPITDITLPWFALIEQAKRDLPNLTMLAHAQLTGAGRWSVAESRTVPGSGGITPWVLIFEAPAEAWRPADEPDQDGEQWVNPDRAAAVTELDQAGLGLAEVLRRIGMKQTSFERWCHRNGFNTTFSRLRARDRGQPLHHNQHTKKAS
jgi:hypothetical protein